MIALGIDQSYACSGFSVYDGTKLLFCKAFDLSKFETKRLRRIMFRSVMRACMIRFKPDVVFIERVRVFSGGMVSGAAIQALGHLIALTVDVAGRTPVYSVDTRAWKSAVGGSAKMDKAGAVSWIKKHHDLDVTHDAADSAMIAMYAFVPPAKQKAKLES